MSKASSFASYMARSGDLLFSFGILGIVFILVLPMPTFLLDVLLASSIALSVVIILTVADIKEPTDFFVFPTVLLFVTLYRLGLNIATTRSILISGDGGHLINSFGQFVVQGNMAVGIIIFVILTIINFVVITKGAGRVAEVAARFTLDAMPGKQMSIDADLNSGVISEQEARARRKGLEREASFFGAMDGASKFVRGDAIAGILITGINLVGGFAVGILQMNLSASESMHKFSLLSVGDGLVSQIPALLISTAAGILVTRSNSSTGIGEDVARQMLSDAKIMYVTGGLLWVMMFVPGFPMVALFFLGAFFLAVGAMLPKKKDGKDGVGTGGKAAAGYGAKGKAGDPAAKEETAVRRSEILALELGVGLLPLVQGSNQNLLERIAALRRALSVDIGITIPAISIRDNASLTVHQYRILLRGMQIATGEILPGQFLAMGVGSVQRPLRGRVTTEPAFGLPATWVADTDRRDAQRLGYTVVDPLSVLTTHLSETLKNHSAELLTRQDVQNLLDELKGTYPAVLQEMNLLQLGLGTVHRVMQNLLRENVAVRDLPLILEKLCDQVVLTKNPDELSEACRKVLTLQLARKCDIRNNKLHAITLHPELEQQLSKGLRQTAQEIALVIDPSLARHIHKQIGDGVEQLTREGFTVLLLCSPLIRLGLKRFFSDTFPTLQVMAYNEIPPTVQLEPVYTIRPLTGMAAAA
ncbi:MAG: hypothetical protein B9S32_18005 [Verrucomicrobia bacterium Tous-C9LFEB]|nr:MAG: hypothetical protein B9S32_18005 [Verrucomicrobia bacterium Tous-C9LFEB]